MAWDNKYINYGVIKIDGKKVIIYSSKDSHIVIDIGVKVINAVWAGSFLNVSLENGRTKRYSSRDNSTLI